MKPTKVKVTAEHIKKGVRGSACKCPVALALKDAGYKEPSVDRCYITFYDSKGTYIELITGTRIENFIDDFDDLDPVKPIVISVPLPPTYIHIDILEMEVN